MHIFLWLFAGAFIASWALAFVGSFFGLAESHALLKLKRWAFGIGPIIATQRETVPLPPGLLAEGDGETLNARYRVLPGHLCLFRRKPKLSQPHTPFTMKGTVEWKEGALTITGRYFLSTGMIFGGGLGGWTAGALLYAVDRPAAGFVALAGGFLVAGAARALCDRMERRLFADYAREVRETLMSADKTPFSPDPTAVRVALWRALHVERDAPPHALEDRLGLELAAPDADWRDRPDMDDTRIRGFRASVVARARFVEDLVAERAAEGVAQYVILGAGLDTFAQRRADLAARLRVFELDRPGPQQWKRGRLAALGYGVPAHLKLVPVDLEAREDWLAALKKAGFDPATPAVFASTGVSMYVTDRATADTMRAIASLAPRTVLAMTFLLPLELLAPEDRFGFSAAMKGAKASGTPFISLYEPERMLAMARAAGFKKAEHLPSAELSRRAFGARADHLHSSSGEDLLVATV